MQSGNSNLEFSFEFLSYSSMIIYIYIYIYIFNIHVNHTTNKKGQIDDIEIVSNMDNFYYKKKIEYQNKNN